MFTDNVVRDVAIGCGWSIVMTIGFIGLGSALCLILNLKERAEWLKATLGFAIFIVVGTFLDYYSLATRLNLLLLLFLGLALWVSTNGIKNLWETLKYTGWSGTALIATATFVACLGANSWMFDINWDDSSGYLPVCHQMSVSGQSWAPLSLRRILAWGGQYPPQTLGMLFTSDLGGAIYDRSVGSWIALLITLAALREKKTNPLTAIAGAFLIILPQTPLNTAPAVIPTFLFCALYVERKNIPISALLLAAIALTRTQLAAPAAIVALFSLLDLYKEKGVKSAFTYLALVPALTFSLCLGGILLQQQIYGTPTVFLNPGPLNKDYISFEGHSKYLLENLQSMTAIIPELGGLIGLLILGLAPRMTGLAIGTMFFFLLTMPEYSTVEFRRYAWPLIAASFYLATISGWGSNRKIITIILIATSYYPISTLTKFYNKASEGLEKSTSGEYHWQKGPKAQMKIPEGRTIIWISGQPALLDYGRNTIINWDSFPAVGNSPQKADPDEWRKWAQSYGADYLACDEFTPMVKKQWAFWNDPNNLKHYVRVWFPDRERGIKLLEELENKVPTYKYNGYVFYDLRPEGSPYELDIPLHEIEELKQEEIKEKEHSKRWKQIEAEFKAEEKKWMEYKQEKQAKRDQDRIQRDRRRMSETNNNSVPLSQ